MSNRNEIESRANSLVSNFISQEQPTENKDIVRNSLEQKKTIKKDTKTDIENNTNNDIKTPTNNKLTFDLKSNSYNKKNNKSITIKVDADLYDFVCNIENISFIESLKCGKIKSQTKTDYINDLIRDRFYKIIDVKSTDKADDISKKWLNYKDKIGL